MRSVYRTIGLLLIMSAPLLTGAQTLADDLAKVYQQMDSVKSFAGMMKVSSQFDMLAGKFPGEWASNYYAAYAKTIISFMETDSRKKDLFLDEADKYLVKVKSADSLNVETYVIWAFITNARIAVDGESRGRKYGKVFDQLLDRAKSINPDDPRIYYLKGMSLFYTPKMFGGGKKKAKLYFEKAKDLFVKESKTSVLKPFWGEKQNQETLDKCGK